MYTIHRFEAAFIILATMFFCLWTIHFWESQNWFLQSKFFGWWILKIEFFYSNKKSSNCIQFALFFVHARKKVLEQVNFYLREEQILSDLKATFIEMLIAKESCDTTFLSWFYYYCRHIFFLWMILFWELQNYFFTIQVFFGVNRSYFFLDFWLRDGARRATGESERSLPTFPSRRRLR